MGLWIYHGFMSTQRRFLFILAYGDDIDCCSTFVWNQSIKRRNLPITLSIFESSFRLYYVTPNASLKLRYFTT